MGREKGNWHLGEIRTIATKKRSSPSGSELSFGTKLLALTRSRSHPQINAKSSRISRLRHRRRTHWQVRTLIAVLRPISRREKESSSSFCRPCSKKPAKSILFSAQSQCLLLFRLASFRALATGEKESRGCPKSPSTTRTAPSTVQFKDL